MDGGTLAYGPVSTLAECLQHIAGCTECKGRWPAVPGMLAMTRRPDGHVDFEVSAAEGGGGGLVAAAAGPPGLRLLPDSREQSQDSREDRFWDQRTESYQIVWDRRDHFWELRRASGVRLGRLIVRKPYADMTDIADLLHDHLSDDLDFDSTVDDVEIELTVTVSRRV